MNRHISDGSFVSRVRADVEGVLRRRFADAPARDIRDAVEELIRLMVATELLAWADLQGRRPLQFDPDCGHDHSVELSPEARDSWLDRLRGFDLPDDPDVPEPGE